MRIMSDPLVVFTENCKVRGRIEDDYHGGRYYAYSGIPYAKSPIGELRFKAPQPPDSWSGVRDGTKEGPEAPTRKLLGFAIGNEDNCLNLNVYTKQLPPKNSNTNLLPVMVFIHGGSFTSGSNRERFTGPQFLLTQDIVLVTINYRLGVLGFLSLEDQSLGVPGNAGLKDQVMALKWVQKNIRYFAGDPNNVTIFGISAGSASVHFLTLSPLSKGLFHKVIMQSGCALNPWTRGKRNAADIAKLMGFDSNIDETSLLEKLMGTSTKNLMEAQFKMRDIFYPSIQRPFGPVIEYQHEGAFLTEDPEEIIKSGRNHQVPIIIGYTSMEGLLYESVRRMEGEEIPDNLFLDVPYSLNIADDAEMVKNVIDELQKFYFEDGDVSKKNIISRYKMFGDYNFVHGIQKTLKFLKQQDNYPVYMYLMTVISPLNILKMSCQTDSVKTGMALTLLHKYFGKYTSIFDKWRSGLLVKDIPGVAHGDDIFYLFHTIMTPYIDRGSKEDLYIQRFVKMWTNFARCGQPTPEDDGFFGDLKWMPIVDDDVNGILEIGDELRIVKNMENERVEFWNDIYRKFNVLEK